MKYAVVTCNDSKRWGYSEGTAQRIIKVFSKEGEHWTAFHAVRGDVPTIEDLEKFQAFVLSGSSSSVNENAKWMLELEEFIRKAAEVSSRNNNRRPKLIGLCFGHQLIAKALGGKVGLNPSGDFVLQTEEIKPAYRGEKGKEEHDGRATDENKDEAGVGVGARAGAVGIKRGKAERLQNREENGEELLGNGGQQRREKIFKDLFTHGSLRILESHGECVTELPKGSVTLGTSRSCENEIILFTEDILGFQCHPDVMYKDAENLILPVASKTFDWSEEKIKQVKEMLAMNVDADRMIHAIREFINE